MFKLDLEKAEEPEVKLQHPLDHRRSRRVPEKHLLLFYWLHQSLWLCGSQSLWKIWKEMGIPDHLTFLLRNLYAGQEATVRIRHGTMDWFKIGKWICQSCILSPCLFNLYTQSIILEMLGWMKHKLESRLQGEISIISVMQIAPTLWQKVKGN